jgi:hypothetical protein
MFQQPTAGSDFRAADHIGHLLLIYPRELRVGIVTAYGTSDAIGVDLIVLSDPAGPRTETQVLFFQKPLIGSLKGSIGKDPVLARLGQGTAKPGQSAPYILNPFTEQDAAFATQYLQSVGGNPFNTAPAFQQAAASAPAPAPAPLPVAVPQAAPAAYPVPQAAPAAAPVQVPPAAAGQAITLADGRTVTPEQYAAMQQLGMVPATP